MSKASDLKALVVEFITTDTCVDTNRYDPFGE